MVSIDVRPLKELGFDPILKMPDFESFAAAVGKRKVIHRVGYSLMQGTYKSSTFRSKLFRRRRQLGCVYSLHQARLNFRDEGCRSLRFIV